MAKNDGNLEFATFDDIFNHPDARERHSKQFNKTNQQTAPPRKGGELYSLLQRQRMLVDGAAIHFISQGKEGGRRADARNSVFKLAQKYKTIPDSENVANIKRMFGNVRGEEEASGDEDWEPSYKKLPSILRERVKNKGVAALQEDDGALREDLLAEMDNIESEASQVAANGALTTEEINIPPEQDQSLLEIDRAFTLSSPTKPAAPPAEETNEEEEEDEEDSDEEDLGGDDLNRMNTLQREFMGNNLREWFEGMVHQYQNGVKLVKVNAMGRKFIRLVTIHGVTLTITQPHSMSTANVKREVSILEIEGIDIGNKSKEFDALNQLVEQGQEAREFVPSPTLCAVVNLPKGRSVSLVFLKEDQRNNFVFYLRVLMKRAKSVAGKGGASAW